MSAFIKDRIKSLKTRFASPPGRVSPLERTYAELEREWLDSPQRKSLVQLLEEHFLSRQDIEIENALCLGLGSFSKREVAAAKLAGNAMTPPPPDRNDCISPPSENKGDDKVREGVGESHGALTAVRRRGSLGSNSSLYQLLLFETALACLRTRHRITRSTIQDPTFSTADRSFLEKRGHNVVPYPLLLKVSSSGNLPLDESLLEGLSRKTFFYAPGLDAHVLAHVLLALKPLLYWGSEMCLFGNGFYFLHSKSPGYALRDSLAELAHRYDFRRAPIGSSATEASSASDEGFMYPFDKHASDETRAERREELQQRIARAEGEAEHVSQVLAQNEDDRKAEAKSMGRFM